MVLNHPAIWFLLFLGLFCNCMRLLTGLFEPRAGNMSLQEVTLDRITKSNTDLVMVVLRPVDHQMKQLPGKDKGTWWKVIVRLVDQKGQGLYQKSEALLTSMFKSGPRSFTSQSSCS